MTEKMSKGSARKGELPALPPAQPSPAKPGAGPALENTVLILRTCSADMLSHGGFRWPESGPVEVPDWNPKHVCGGGLHGLLWGEGSVSYLNLDELAKWIVFRAQMADLAHGTGELIDKCKARAGTVEYCGCRDGAISYLMANGAAGKAVVFGTATAGDSGTATAGYSGVITILYWNDKRYKARIAQVKDEDGYGELEPNTPYRLNVQGNFTRADAAPRSGGDGSIGGVERAGTGTVEQPRSLSPLNPTGDIL